MPKTTSRGDGVGLRRLGGRLTLFTALPLIGLVVPLLALPVVARVGDAHNWVGLGVGQAVGALAQTLVMWGWWAAGPTRFATTRNRSERASLYFESHYQRATLAAVIVPLAAVVSLVIAPAGGRIIAVLAAVSLSANGLLPSWFFMSMGKPTGIAVYDDLPIAASVLLGTGLVVVSGLPWLYCLPQALVGFVSPVVFMAQLRRREPLARRPTWRSAIHDGIEQWPIAATNMIGSSYSAAPVPVASHIAAPGLVPLTSADKLYRFGAFAPTALVNALQAWAFEDASRFRRRQLFGIAAHTALGIAGCVILTLLGPLASRILFGAALSTTWEVSLALGTAFLWLSIGTSINRLVLLPAGRSKVILLAGVVGAVAGLATMFCLSRIASSTGVAWGLAVSEFVVVAVGAGPALRSLGQYPTGRLAGIRKTIGEASDGD